MLHRDWRRGVVRLAGGVSDEGFAGDGGHGCSRVPCLARGGRAWDTKQTKASG